MSERSNLITKLLSSMEARTAYIKAKIGISVPSQIRALRIKSEMPRQADLAKAAGLHQSRISMFETPGAANITLETLSRLAAAFKVGLIVKFVPMSEMLRSENDYSQDAFSVLPIEKDYDFIDPSAIWREQSYTRNAGGASQLGNQINVPLQLSGMPGFAVTASHAQESQFRKREGVSAAWRPRRVGLRAIGYLGCVRLRCCGKSRRATDRNWQILIDASRSHLDDAHPVGSQPV